MKLGNFGRLDPELKKRGIKGLTGGSKGEIEIWNEFKNNWDNLVIESEKLLADLKPSELLQTREDVELLEGKDVERTVKVRLNQSFFRQSVLNSYESTCAITGINCETLLVASHIVPWSKDETNRLNPMNGICLNSLHDKAFDKGLITITADYKIVLSARLNEFERSWVDSYFAKYEGQKIYLPQKFAPDKNFLEYHNSEIFQK